MNLVTEPIHEKKLQEIPYLDFVESYTKSGESVVFIALKDNTPPEMVPDIWYKVRKKMQDLTPSLPVGVSPQASMMNLMILTAPSMALLLTVSPRANSGIMLKTSVLTLLQVPNVGNC